MGIRTTRANELIMDDFLNILNEAISQMDVSLDVLAQKLERLFPGRLIINNKDPSELRLKKARSRSVNPLRAPTMLITIEDGGYVVYRRWTKLPRPKNINDIIRLVGYWLGVTLYGDFAEI